MRTLKMKKPSDLHLHFRWGAEMRACVPAAIREYDGMLWMPNPAWQTKDGKVLKGGVFTGPQVQEYQEALVALGAKPDRLISTIKLVDTASPDGAVVATTPDIIFEAWKCGVRAAKLYPAGVTTNSADGVRSISKLFTVFAQMQRLEMVLCVHAEAPDPEGGEYSIMDREFLYLNTLRNIISAFPKLRVVMEHVSSKAGVDFVKQYHPGTVRATVTAHHLYLTLNSCCGQNLHVCRPIPKKADDRAALIAWVLSGDERVGFGSDMAPHAAAKKFARDAAFGVYALPQVAMSKIISLFARYNALDKVEAFCTRLLGFYGFTDTQETVEYVEQPFTVPDMIGEAMPWCAGETLMWCRST